MMVSFLVNKVRPIGLDIGHHSIKMLQLAVSGDSIGVIAAGKAPIADCRQENRAEAISSAIKTLLQTNRFHGRTVISCLPSELLKIKSVRIETNEEEKIEELIRTDIAERFGLNAQTDSIKYMVAGHVQQGSEIRNELLVFAADNASVKNHIELLEASGLVPVGIDTVPCALFRSFERTLRRQEDKDIANIFVDVGSYFTTVVVGRGRDITFVKQIPMGGDKFNSDIAVKLGLDNCQASRLRAQVNDDPKSANVDAATKQAMSDSIRASVEQLAKEISLCFRYYSVTFRGSRPGKLIFAGGEAYESSLIESLKRQLGLEIEIAQPLRGFDLNNSAAVGQGSKPMCEWAVAVGLGLKGSNFDESGTRQHERN